MDKYSNDDEAVPSLANAIADVELGKNLLLHLDEVMRGAIGIKDVITQRRSKSELVDNIQNALIDILEFIYLIRFKIETSDQNLKIPINTIGLVTNLELSSSDYNDNTNLSFHIATLTYDIDSVDRTIKEEIETGKSISETVLNFKALLVKLKDMSQSALNKQND